MVMPMPKDATLWWTRTWRTDPERARRRLSAAVAKWGKQRAAVKLGLAQSTLYRWCNEMGVTR